MTRALALATLLVGCPGEPEPVDATADLCGRVTDGAAPVAGAAVRAGDRLATTDARGVFHLADLPPDAPIEVAVDPAPPRLGAARVVWPVDGQTVVVDLVAPLAAEAALGEGIGATATVASAVGDVILTVRDAPLARADGAAVVGPVRASLAALDPSALTGGALAEAPPAALAAAIRLSLADADGAVVQPGAGGALEVAVPVPEALCGGLSASPGAWTWDGAAWAAAGSASLDGCVVALSLPHLSDWVAGDPLDTVWVTGVVLDATGAAVAGAAVRAEGVDYGYRADAVADALGAYALPVRRAHAARLGAEVWRNGLRWASPDEEIEADALAADEPERDLVLDLDLSTPCDPVRSPITRELSLSTIDGEAHAVALSLPLCGAFDVSELGFGANDVVLHAGIDGGPFLILEGTWNDDELRGAQPPWVEDYGAQALAVPFDEALELPEGGYAHDRVVSTEAQVDWRWPLQPGDPPRAFAVRTVQGLYGRLEISEVGLVDGRYAVSVRYQVQPDGTPRMP